MVKKLREHFTAHEIFYHSIRTACVMIFLLFLALVMEMVSK